MPTLLWVIATLVLVTLPHIFRLAWWIPIFFGFTIVWRYLMTRNQWELPRSWMQFALILFIVLAVILSYRTMFGRDASIGLLVALCGLKLVEMNSHRDALLLCFLSYFLIITHFLYSQSIPTTLYMAVVMLVATGTLISLNDEKNSLPVRQRLRLSGTLLLQALPVMLVLFILFPRVAGPFWRLPINTHSGMTGLSDDMSLGNISQLSQSDEIAFRVKFEGKIPPPSERYWRGPVLWWTNGRDWKSGIQHHKHIDKVKFNSTSRPYDYTITLEPHNKRWLFALDLPSKTPFQSDITSDYQLLATFPVNQRKRYQLRSYTDYHADIFTYQQNQLALQLPSGKHRRARALAKQWQQDFQFPNSQLSSEAIVQRALQHFNQEPFRYTHTPPLLFDDPVDEFLFETRQGFCEHYAAAFTILMRAADIPARVVTGYLGGTVNPIGNYLIVRQRDAHAWSEVWLPDKGWVRIDPTGAIAPSRIDQGIDTALPSSPFNSLGLEINLDYDALPVKIWQQVRNSWDAINNGWNQWVLGYGPEQQRFFLKKLGLGGWDWRGITTLLVIIISVFLLSYAVWMFLRPQIAHDPVQRIYWRFCKKMAKEGYKRHASEGPLTYAARLSRERPDLAIAIQNIIELYIQTRYRSQIETLPQLRTAVRHFKVKGERGKDVG
ncbi:transglutaminase domain protein [Beggiatoa sp. PS]|nr:transglutaminase domain protein [Beggiatoa sp. PS]